MNPLNQPPLQQKISEEKSGLVDRIWFGFFLQLWQMFSQESYGDKTLTLNISGITGSYTTDYQYITDRNFVWFDITLTPSSIFTASGATITGLEDLPIIDNNIEISITDSGTTKDSRIIKLGEDSIIHIPDFTSTTYKIVISGKYIKQF